jgi:hypothetical protein
MAIPAPSRSIAVYTKFRTGSKRIGRYIDYYNTERPHASLEGRHPIDEYLRLAS